jgi:ribose 5-phosphate isomerase B
MENTSLPPLFFGSDHAGRELKDILVSHARAQGYPVTDLGTDSDVSVDYPDYAQKVGESVLSNAGSLGVLVCGTGIGMSIAANKLHGIRAALLYNEETARLARRHNNANIVTMGGREVPPGQAVQWLDAFLSSAFEDGRHSRRLDKVAHLESLVADL